MVTHTKIFFVIMLGLLLPGVLQARPLVFNERLQSTLTDKTSSANRLAQLITPDEHGTPPIMDLARQGKAEAFQQLRHLPGISAVLDVEDKYGNNLFHVAKDVNTIQAISALVRDAQGANTAQKISSMVDKKNSSGETTFFAQINAGHPDAFRTLYRYSSLKKENDEAMTRLNRLEGSDERIVAKNRFIYCTQIRKHASANGRTLLEAAKDQVPYYPQMAPLVQTIERRLPCLVQ